jgi:transcriptional regulator with XRE-family HTH domain
MSRLFGEKLRSLRRRSALTQVELIERLRLTAQAHIANLEAGRDAASLDLIVRVARVFGVTTDYLLRDTVPVEPAPSSAAIEFWDGNASAQHFGEKLRSLRLHQGWGQTTLARQLGLARRGYISNLEAGRKMPSPELVVRIADLFNVTTDYLLSDDVPIKSEFDS